MTQPKVSHALDRKEENQFLELVAQAIGSPSSTWSDAPGKMPWIEAPRKVIEFYNRGKMEGFESSGFFVLGGCRVYEEGKRDERIAHEARSCSERDFGWRAR